MNQYECPICLAISNNFIKTICDHAFHTDCLNEWKKINQSCPLCRKDLVSPIPILFWYSRDDRTTIPMIAIPGYVPPQPEILPIEDNNIPMNLLFGSSF